MNSENKLEEDGDGLCWDDKDSADEAIGQDGEDVNEDVNMEEDDIAGEGEKTSEIIKKNLSSTFSSCL